MPETKKRDGDSVGQAMFRTATRGIGSTCACDVMPILHPEYHWPHCKHNPSRTAGLKDKLSAEPQALVAVSQPPKQAKKRKARA